ncbi:plasminogen-like [Mercenaria mercenaria]|uniref:plasminogen-like n=1 Tax=Mercenaria mercenaria TaxID=6596 RepID=UPI00234EE305|nr:plasminogen-like [Mercenaria mercenaria]
MVDRLPDCGIPPSVQNGTIVLDNVSGTAYMDTATITCDAWYQTRRSKITCMETGNWENTICADCYLTTPDKYAGERNWTVSGTACQRWDAQYPHTHSYTNPSTYPDATLQQANNYCRNPDKDTFEPWCYTVNNNARWEYCGVSICV